MNLVSPSDQQNFKKPEWTFKHFNQLTAGETYAILKLRSEVFVVEQQCVYQDADGKDQQSHHLCGWYKDNLIAYARILPPGISYKEASIGRVVTSPFFRNKGAGKALMEKSIEKTISLYKVSEIKIGAQSYLEKFYSSLGFKISGPAYLEDGIPHIEMKYTL